jgi:hypothetical protein
MKYLSAFAGFFLKPDSGQENLIFTRFKQQNNPGSSGFRCRKPVFGWKYGGFCHIRPVCLSETQVHRPIISVFFVTHTCNDMFPVLFSSGRQFFYASGGMFYGDGHYAVG